jgi:hypothetical protein
LAKPNYGFEKRQRELAKKKKQEEKNAKKREARNAGHTGTDGIAAADDAAQRRPAAIDSSSE